MEDNKKLNKKKVLYYTLAFIFLMVFIIFRFKSNYYGVVADDEKIRYVIYNLISAGGVLASNLMVYYSDKFGIYGKLTRNPGILYAGASMIGFMLYRIMNLY